MNTRPVISIVWFRNDLRVTDNPALHYAALAGVIIPVFIFNNKSSGEIGSASRWWLHNALNSLSDSLEKKLQIYMGNPEQILHELVQQYNVQNVYVNSCYEPEQFAQDEIIKKSFKAVGVEYKIFHSQLLWDPATIVTGYGTPYKVFTPFYQNGCLQATPPRLPFEKHEKLDIHKDIKNSIAIDQLELLKGNSWSDKLHDLWNVSEQAALNRLQEFIQNGLIGYKENRNIPSVDGTSRLSPYLHFGQISAHQIWHAVHVAANHDIPVQDVSCFLSEIGWREFCYNLLFNFPQLPDKNFNAKFNEFPWLHDNKNIQAWKDGKTGIPIVDAGMRELAQTGYMHNRVRMIVASFLIKNLGIDWRLGKDWFWECLVDADLANNSANWQWVAGCGADAAPFFRIFNPILQGEKFDPQGVYTRKYVPELALMPDKYLYKPWLAPMQILKQAGVIIGKNYPAPIVDLGTSRNHALAAYKKL